MSTVQSVESDHLLVRLLQTGIVLEEVAESRARRYAEATDVDGDPATAADRGLVDRAADAAAGRRETLERLAGDLATASVPLDEVDRLVAERHTAPVADFDGVLYDLLCGAESAYKFYDDLLAAVEATDRASAVDRERLAADLRDLRADAEACVSAVTAAMDDAAGSVGAAGAAGPGGDDADGGEP